jgi:four helix bundle suffix protein
MLTNVARASLEELLADYQDYLRVKGLQEWNARHPYALRLRELNRQPDADYGTFRKGIEHENPEICANVIIGLIKVCCHLLDRQLESFEREFLEHGVFVSE